MKNLQDSSPPVPEEEQTYAGDIKWRQISTRPVSLHRVISGICMRGMVFGGSSEYPVNRTRPSSGCAGRRPADCQRMPGHGKCAGCTAVH
jgi:hypothetical protein